MEQFPVNQQSQSMTRRAFLRQVFAFGGVSAGAALLGACGASSSTTTAVPSAAATAATGAPTSDAAAITAVAQETTTAATAGAASTATTGIAPTSEAAATAGAASTATTEQSATPAIVAAANAFLATLSDTEKADTLFDWSNTEQKQRWSNFPEGLFTRDGLMWGNISETQQNAWLALMQATLSTEGYNRVLAEWNADEALAAQESSGGGGGQPQNGTAGAGTGSDGGTPPAGAPDNGTPPAGGFGGGNGGPGGQLLYGKKYYWIAIIGTPSETSAWQWQWGGHHVTVNATIVGANLSLTPSFIGVQPASYTDANGNTVRPLGDIEDEAFALINSLDATQQQAAILGDTGIDLVLGPGQDGKTIQAEGLPAAQMNADQKAAFLKLIEHYTNLGYNATARTADIQSTLDQTYLAWYGPTTAGSAVYFRVTGPTIVIEYSPQQMGGNAANHIHGIYRDPTNDYGAKYTGTATGS